MSKLSVICNTSPIIGLMSINRLNLLWQLFDKIFIPQAVQKELCANSIEHLQEVEEVKHCILELAKKQGVIDFIKPDIDLLRNSGYRISEALYIQILTRNGELD